MPTDTKSPFQAINGIDYTVILTRDMAAMRRFYEEVMGFAVSRELSAGWIEYQIGPNTFVLSQPGRTADDASIPTGTAAVQLAFKVSPGQVDACATELTRQNVPIMSPPTNHGFGHRTLFFRDPDGNLLEIYAEI